MASTAVSSANFQSILDAALGSCAKQTGPDLTRDRSADKLQCLRSLEEVVHPLGRETALKDYRDKHRQLMDCRPNPESDQLRWYLYATQRGTTRAPDMYSHDKFLASIDLAFTGASTR